MDNEEQIKDLQRQISDLSEKSLLFQQELYVLQTRLNALRKDAGDTVVPADREDLEEQELPTASRADTGLENYIGLRYMHIIGIIVLVTGLSIGVKYAIDRQLISVIMRIVLAYAAGVVLLILSLRLKRKYRFFSAILFSGSMASVYFTTYAAFVYYGFFPVYIAFGIMGLLTVYTVINAIHYDRQEIAVLGMVGAYGIPFLISANAERVDLFFSYIVVINIGVAFISSRKSWRLMQYLALLITWLLFIGWELFRFAPSLQLTGILFMSAYYILFLWSAIARRMRQSVPLLPGEMQQVIINNTALYLAVVLLFGNGGFDINIALATGVSALFAGILALVIYGFFPSEIILQRMLAWQFIVLLVLFAGFQWNGVMVTLAWLAIAVLLFIWGAVSKKSWPRLAAILLIGFTLAKLVIFDSTDFSTVQKILSFLVIGILLLLFSFYYQKYNLLDSKTDKK